MDIVEGVLAIAAQYVPLLLVCVLLFAVVDAALGMGAVVPGETAIVLASVALSGNGAHLAAAVAAAAVGAFIGDHIGFRIGRFAGTRFSDSKLVARLGRDRWEQAQSFVERRFWAIIVGRQLPGVRTFIAVAAGASTMRHARFALASAIAALLWATLWVIGGAFLGGVIIDVVDQWTIPTLLTIVAATVGAIVISALRRRRRAS